MRLNHNMNSLSAYTFNKKNIVSSASAMEKISSGLKVSSAKDNPNKIGQSDLMRIQLKSLQAAQKNIQDSVSMLQTSDGALQTANNILSRMEELAVSAADGTKSEADKNAIQDELTQLKGNLNALASDTEFNGVKVIGNPGVNNNKYPVYISNQVGNMVGEDIRIPMYNISCENFKDDNNNKLSDMDFTTTEGASKGITTVQSAIRTISSIRGKLGAMCNRLESTGENASVVEFNTQRAQSSLVDADIGKELVELARTEILNNSSTALIAQCNQIPMNALRVLENIRR